MESWCEMRRNEENRKRILNNVEKSHTNYRDCYPGGHKWWHFQMVNKRQMSGNLRRFWCDPMITQCICHPIRWVRLFCSMNSLLKQSNKLYFGVCLTIQSRWSVHQFETVRIPGNGPELKQMETGFSLNLITNKSELPSTIALSNIEMFDLPPENK